MIPHLYNICKQISGTQAGWAKNQCGRDEEIFADGSLGRGPCHRGTGGFGSQREESYLLFDQVSSDDLPRPRSASFNINRNKRRTYSHVSAFRFLAFSFLTCLTNSHQELFCSTPFWFFSFSPFPVLPPCPKCPNRKHNKYCLCFPPGCDKTGRTIEHHCLTMLRLLLFNSSHISLHKKSIQGEFFVLSNSCKCSLRGGLRPLKKRRRAANQIVCTLSSNCDNHKSICIFFLFMIMLWNILNQPVDKSYLQEINSNRTSI